jgi:hypothetical protein
MVLGYGAMKILPAPLAAAFLLAASLSGCAVQHSPTQLAALPPTQQARPCVLLAPVEIRLATGYARSLKQGSAWQPVGSTAQGMVFRPLDDAFTVEGAHVHEAYLVVQEGQLVGFYLPAERGFSRLEHPIPIHFKQG